MTRARYGPNPIPAPFILSLTKQPPEQEHRPTSPMQPQGVKKAHKQGRHSRVPLSCDPCRTRKLRCNREKPCQNCTTRDEGTNCKYKGFGTGISSTERPHEHGHSMQQRIDHLESLVKRLIAQKQEIPANIIPISHDSGAGFKTTPGASNVSKKVTLESSAHTAVVDGVHSVYKGTDDWYDVLQEINELKKLWSETQDDQANCNIDLTFSNTVDGSSLLFGQIKPIEKIEILATLPHKPEVDKLIRQFFDRDTLYISVPPILHEPTFMREYAEHWKDPSKTNIIWLGLLFSILGIVMLSYSQFGEPPEYEGISESLFHLYRVRTAQCLIIGDISKCLPYTLEALRLNATAELNRKDDNSRGLWIMTGVIVRAAINMGYHREPSRSSSISIVQAEYRRRVWLSVIGMDDVASYVLGFPRMLPTIDSDTMEPRNLHDWELSENTVVLPPSRPLTEPTPATYLIVKGRLFRALSRITDLNNNPSFDSYATVLDIDNCLYQAYQDMPSNMKVYSRTGNLSTFDKKSDFSNMRLESMYHHGMCTLHRKFIAKARFDSRFTLSRDRCISSALVLLDLQNILEPSWYKFSHMRKMLTLAAMLLFLELEHRRRDSSMNPSFDNDALLQALKNSCSLWENAQRFCEEAQRISQILSGMLSSFRTASGTNSYQTENQETQFAFPSLSPQHQPFNDSISLENDIFSMSNENDIDWATWDSLIESTNFKWTR